MKEELRLIYEENIKPGVARKKIKKWLIYAGKFWSKLARTMTEHLEGICNYFIKGSTKGLIEGINNKIKLVKRQAYGFTNFENFRPRIIAAFRQKINLSP